MKKFLGIILGVLLVGSFTATKAHAFTLNDLMGQIVSLRSEVAQLKSGLGGQVLGVSSDKESVVKLQTELKSQGLYTGAIDGIAGPLTQAAVVKSQTANTPPTWIPPTTTTSTATVGCANGAIFSIVTGQRCSTVLPTIPTTSPNTGATKTKETKIIPIDVKSAYDKFTGLKQSGVTHIRLSDILTPQRTDIAGRAPIGPFMYVTCFEIQENGGWLLEGSGWIDTRQWVRYMSHYYNGETLCFDWGETGEI